MDDCSPSSSAPAPQMRFGKIDDLVSRVAVSVDAARKFLFSQQTDEGYWCGELEADTQRPPARLAARRGHDHVAVGRVRVGGERGAEETGRRHAAAW